MSDDRRNSPLVMRASHTEHEGQTPVVIRRGVARSHFSVPPTIPV